MKSAFGVEHISKGVPQGIRAAVKPGSVMEIGERAYPGRRLAAHKYGRQAAKAHRQAIDADREMIREYTRAGKWNKGKKYIRLKLKERTKVILGSKAKDDSNAALAMGQQDRFFIKNGRFKQRQMPEWSGQRYQGGRLS